MIPVSIRRWQCFPTEIANERKVGDAKTTAHPPDGKQGWEFAATPAPALCRAVQVALRYGSMMYEGFGELPNTPECQSCLDDGPY